MNPTMPLANDRLAMWPRASARWNATERLVRVLTALGIIASLIAFLSYQEALKSQLKPDELNSPNIVKSQLYYAAYATQLILLISAGLLAFFSTDPRSLERKYRLYFALFVGAALLMTVRGYSLSGLASTRLADSRGPFPYLISVLVFIGANRRNWRFLDRAMVLLVILLCTLLVLGMAGLQRFSRQEGVASFAGLLNAMYWPASWVVLKDYPPQSVGRRLRFVPLVIYGVGSLFTQTRLNFVMLFALLVLYAYLQKKRRVPQGAGWMIALGLGVWVSLFVAVFLKDTRPFEQVRGVADAFYGRLDQDSRTGQIRRFFEDVQPRELLLGRGALATWAWPGMDLEWTGGTDVGYLTVLFYGGLPLLITYIAVILKPSFRVFARSDPGLQHAAACIVLLWGLRMFSSTYPGTTIDAYPVLFFVGACISKPFSEPSGRSYQMGARKAGVAV
jgi:hypothetical protein